MKVKVVEKIKKARHPNCASNLFDVSINITDIDCFTMNHISGAIARESHRIKNKYKVCRYGDETILAGDISIKPMLKIARELIKIFDIKYQYLKNEQMDEMKLKYERGKLKNLIDINICDLFPNLDKYNK